VADHRLFNLLKIKLNHFPTCSETQLDKYEISVQLLKTYENTGVLVFRAHRANFWADSNTIVRKAYHASEVYCGLQRSYCGLKVLPR